MRFDIQNSIEHPISCRRRQKPSQVLTYLHERVEEFVVFGGHAGGRKWAELVKHGFLDVLVVARVGVFQERKGTGVTLVRVWTDEFRMDEK